MRANDYQARRTLRCGYVRAEDWKDAQASAGYVGGYLPGTGKIHPDTCPGYTTALPEVAEVANAWGWWERGQLGMLGELPEAVVTLVELFNRELNAARDWYHEQTRPR